MGHPTEEAAKRAAEGIALGRPLLYTDPPASAKPRENTQIITFVYRNWKGEVRERRVIPINIEFGADNYHQPAQWLLHAIDMDKGARRTFAFDHMLTPIRKD